MSNNPTSLCLRSPEPGKPELSISLGGQPITIELTHQQLWHLVSEGLRQIKAWPMREPESSVYLPPCDV